MFETVAVAVTGAVILQNVYEGFNEKRDIPDYTQENERFRQKKEDEAKSYMDTIRPMLEQELAEHEEPPVLAVEDLTMRFKVATNNVSGLKEYMIQTIKKQMTYKELYALNHISFNVFRGEVVGIIGTNGSGKSTLLKIVSGALNPTQGKVSVDRNKVQLLTLGTGFDMELSARENVYLNGAIIGYSREFIDRHYDEIVEFAELQEFMEEKVKNFSSGMVSRLGFAIATAGEAAEILILDEVLSVGDEFFRRKSLKKIKDMIHGGSTVLMVSHGMGTILENCTKVLWIEQGNLRMIGEPKKVCSAYQHQFEPAGETKVS
jgi:ABC-type polysaccharide/polyol phosphate transport system ATPase subunit